MGDLYDKIEFPLFLTRYLNFSFTDYYDIPFLKSPPKGNYKKGKFGDPSWFIEIDKFVTTKDDINPNHLNLWYKWKENWINISKMTTEYSLNQDFIKSFNNDIKQVPIYTKE